MTALAYDDEYVAAPDFGQRLHRSDRSAVKVGSLDEIIRRCAEIPSAGAVTCSVEPVASIKAWDAEGRRSYKKALGQAVGACIDVVVSAYPKVSLSYAGLEDIWVYMEPNWLASVYAKVGSGDIDDAIDLVLDHVDDLLLDDAFDDCDSVLSMTDVGRLNADLVVAFLSVTKSASQHLCSRAEFVERCRARLRELVPARVDDLLAGLD